MKSNDHIRVFNLFVRFLKSDFFTRLESLQATTAVNFARDQYKCEKVKTRPKLFNLPKFH